MIKDKVNYPDWNKIAKAKNAYISSDKKNLDRLMYISASMTITLILFICAMVFILLS